MYYESSYTDFCSVVGAGKSEAEGGEAEKTSGVNQFWLIALKNCEIFADVIKVWSI